MSGIFGYFDPAGELSPDAPARMAEALTQAPGCRVAVHRAGCACIGVVDKGIFPDCGSILRDELGTRYAVLQGDIVGASRTAKRPRPEDVFCRPLHDLALAGLNGPFSAAVVNPTDNSIELVTDRYGMYLTFYARAGRAVLFASQAKALLATGAIAAQVDEDALALMLTIGEVVGELTLLSGVRSLPSGSVARIGPEGISIRKYWAYGFRPDPRLQFRSAANRAGELLKQAVARRCAGAATTGVPLSGGLDSRCLLALAPDPRKVPSYTWGLRGCRDLRYAAQIAAAVGSPHYEFVTDPQAFESLAPRGVWLTEGLCEINDMHVLPHVDFVAEHSPVILDGYAGDVLFGGNFIKPAWWRAGTAGEAAAALWRWRDRVLPPEVGEPLLGAARYRDTVTRARSLFCKAYESYAADDEMGRAMAFLLDNRIRRCTSSGTHLFRWRLELHQPFFDNDFLDFVSTVPHEWRYRHRLYVEMLRRTAPAVSDIRWQRTGLPARATWPLRFVSAAAHRASDWAAARTPWPDLFASRQVSAFDEWFRGPLRPFCERTLLSNPLAERGLLRRDGLQRVLDAHQNGQDRTRIIGILIALQLFHRLFIDDLAGAVQTFARPARVEPQPALSGIAS